MKMQLAVTENVFGSSLNQTSHVEQIYNGNTGLIFGKEILTVIILFYFFIENFD